MCSMCSLEASRIGRQATCGAKQSIQVVCAGENKNIEFKFNKTIDKRKGQYYIECIINEYIISKLQNASKKIYMQKHQQKTGEISNPKKQPAKTKTKGTENGNEDEW